MIPADFSGWNEDATQWLLAMWSYFAMNPTIVHNNCIQVMTLLNKMSKGKGKTFSEGWLKATLDGSLTTVQRILTILSKDYTRVFYLFDTAERAQINMGNLKQVKSDYKDG